MPRTLRDLNELTAVADNDWVHVNDVTDVLDQDKKITRFNLVGTAITGGGAINTGGFTLTVPATGTAVLKQGTPVAARAVRWNDANKVEDAGIAFDQMVRRTGSFTNLDMLAVWHDTNTAKGSSVNIADVARLGTAQSFALLNTFSTGIRLGATTTTLSHYQEGSFTPAFSFTTSDGGHTTSSAVGTYVRVGTLVAVEIDIRFSALGTAAGNLRIANLPFVPASNKATGTVRWSNMTTNFVYMGVQANTGLLLVQGATAAANTNATAVTAANLTNTSTFLISISYACVP